MACKAFCIFILFGIKPQRLWFYPVTKLENFHRGSKVTGPNIWEGSKTYVSKKIYTKRTCITLLSEKLGGPAPPPPPNPGLLKAAPLVYLV
ncbi:hypothetical protein HanRHA438_Chr15g0732151 [Helianthus annuus]|nr:hypothetical protein HanRHA438_Chr15g0732151 [Helianthus annuus]